jgi:spermidine/putrescine transport system substrate-binding protein
MKRRAFLLGGVVAAGCSRGARLNVYNWSDYIAPETITQFEREFGVRIHYGTYESNQEMLAQVMSGNSGWDVVFPSGDFIAPLRELGLLQPLDHQLLQNAAALAPEFQRPPWDPELRWCIPYMHGVTGILYQRHLQPPVASWADMWDRRLKGRLTMLDDASEVLGVCLKKLGHSINSGDRGELMGAENEALAQKPLLRAYLNAEVRDQAAAGDVLAAQAWAVTAGQAMAAAPGKLAFAFPKEGFPRYADNVAILR